MSSDLYSVVVRYSGERTYNELRRQLSEWVPNVPVGCVSSGSFEKTLRMSYEKAIELHARWTVILDADILLSRRFFFFYLPSAIGRARNVELGFAFRLWDRFYDAPKFRGLHVYKTSMLPLALARVPEEGGTLRPESFVKEQLAAEGAVWSQYGNVVGLHDFYQRPQDIFAKMALRAHRSESDVEYLLKTFERHGGELDFTIAAAGLKYGMGMDSKSVDNARKTYAAGFQEMVTLGLIDISSLNETELRSPAIDRFIFRNLSKFSIKRAIANYFWVHKI